MKCASPCSTVCLRKPIELERHDLENRLIFHSCALHHSLPAWTHALVTMAHIERLQSSPSADLPVPMPTSVLSIQRPSLLGSYHPHANLEEVSSLRQIPRNVVKKGRIPCIPTEQGNIRRCRSPSLGVRFLVNSIEFQERDLFGWR